jgi:hypothetical protein
MTKIYVASSWRNEIQPRVVHLLERNGHQVYDFRHPFGGEHLGFRWSSVDEQWEDWDRVTYRNSLLHPIARAGFHSDFDAMKWADVCVLVTPCGKSAHLEAGYFIGAGKRLVIYLTDIQEAELMYSMADHIVLSYEELLTVVLP